jgi:ADP-heptose:LPS heptosyltransferase
MKKILLLQLKRIGDLILTTPVVAALRQKFAGAEITLIAAGECAELMPAILGVDRCLLVRRDLRDLAMFFAIARMHFDCCIDFTQNDRSALLTFLSGAKTRVVSSRIKADSKIRSRIYNEFASVRLKEMHTLDYNLGLLTPLGITDASSKLQLNVPQSAKEKASQLLRTSKVNPPSPGYGSTPNPFVVFHPGSARWEKLWEPERWAEVIDRARREWGIGTVITGGKSVFEQEHIRAIKANLHETIDSLSPESSPVRVAHPSRSTPAGSIVDLSGQTDLLTLAALIGQARLLVTVDSAAMHLAAALGTPQVALFGPTNPFHWRPREGAALILHGRSDVPVTEFVPTRERLPMQQISTAAVFNAMSSLLSAPAAQFS